MITSKPVCAPARPHSDFQDEYFHIFRWKGRVIVECLCANNKMIKEDSWNHIKDSIHFNQLRLNVCKFKVN
jgi:hypothetical protein